ncbi:hypothetical protein C8J56DRAFT_386520 [Mycena floridula]|nr:hypothetical protein C8J56DRAFT_386520 [Mycena floridula]
MLSDEDFPPLPTKGRNPSSDESASPSGRAWTKVVVQIPHPSSSSKENSSRPRRVPKSPIKAANVAPLSTINTASAPQSMAEHDPDSSSMMQESVVHVSPAAPASTAMSNLVIPAEPLPEESISPDLASSITADVSSQSHINKLRPKSSVILEQYKVAQKLAEAGLNSFQAHVLRFLDKEIEQATVRSKIFKECTSYTSQVRIELECELKKAHINSFFIVYY